MRSQPWRNLTFRTRWSVSSKHGAATAFAARGVMTVRFSTRAPNADYLGFEASPEGAS